MFPSPARAAQPLNVTLFGPESLSYTTGTISRNFSCPTPQGTFNLHVLNGDGAGGGTVSSAVIEMNGSRVVGPNDFNSNVTSIDKALTNLVVGNNALSISLGTSSPTSHITVTITGSYTLDVTILSPAAGAQVVGVSTSVHGTYTSYSANPSLSVNGVAASFAGGTFSAAAVPVPSGAGVFTATISTPDGLSDFDNVAVNGNHPPHADAGPDMSARVGDAFLLDGRNSSDPEGALITYGWTLASKPEGSQSALADNQSVYPSFTPDRSGPYVAFLVVNDGMQNSAPDNVTITADSAPNADAGPDQSVVTGSQVFLDGSGSFDPDLTPVTWSWRLAAVPPESSAVLLYPTTVNPAFVADRDGTYVAELTVSDGVLPSLPDNVSIVSATPNAPPVANAGTDQAASRNTAVWVSGTGSYDPDDDPLAFQWAFVSLPEGSASVLDNATWPSATFVPDREGGYVVRLVVDDGKENSAPDTVVVTAVNDPPVASAVASPSAAIVGTTVSLSGAGSTDANGDPLSYLWSVAGAPAGSAAVVVGATSPSASLAPDRPGTYTIRLVVNDGQADSPPSDAILVASVATPSVVGMTLEDASSVLAASGLSAGVVTYSDSDTVAEGSVLTQSPVAGTVLPGGSTVALTVSSGPRRVTVPDVTGMTRLAAETAVLASDLSVGPILQECSATVPSGSVIRQSPAPGSVVVHGSAVTLTVSLGLPVVPDLSGKTGPEAQELLSPLSLRIGTTSYVPSAIIPEWRVSGQTPVAGTVVSIGSTVNLVISSGPEPVLPPDPSMVAPSLPLSVATSVSTATEFLYTGTNPIQRDVAEGAIEQKRGAAVRGGVTQRDGSHLSGATVTIKDHPELGKTCTRGDGRFDMAVNGGGALTVRYSKFGYLPADRKTRPGWQGFAQVPDVVLVPYDNRVTTVDTSSTEPVQVARGNPSSDASGTRTATLMFPQGVLAHMKLPGGGTQPLPKLNVRATEYSVGTTGPAAMPAPLPPSSAYTYCVELSADEAVSAAADSVVFDREVPFYVENFLGFPVGMRVPVGYYDRARAEWVASKDGRVVKILSVSGGKAELDSTGSGIPDNAERLASLGITDAEREKVASLYPIGGSYWRAALNHFTPYDLNFPVGLPDNAAVPDGDSPFADIASGSCGSTIGGWSTLECRGQTLGEDFPVTGSPYSLTYRSDRVPGRTAGYTARIPLSGTGPHPVPPLRIELEISIAGRTFESTFPWQENFVTSFEWDGKDAYGRFVQGGSTAEIRIGYVHASNYLYPEEWSGIASSSFGMPGGNTATVVPSRQEVTVWRNSSVLLRSWDAQGIGLGVTVFRNIHPP